MSSSRRPRRSRASGGWAAVTAATCVFLVLVVPAAALFTGEEPLASRWLSASIGRAVLRQAVPIMGILAGEPEDESGAASLGPRTVSGWFFAAFTGISPGNPTTFLQANLPFARTSYATAIMASGRAAGEASSSPPRGSTAVPPIPTQGSGAGGGLSPGRETGSDSQTDTPKGPAGGRQVEGHLFLFGEGEPTIGIVHTHSTESYLPIVCALAMAADSETDTSTLEAFTADSSANMLRVGEELARCLSTTHGLTVMQSRRVHDDPADGFRLGAYERSLESMTEMVRRFPSLKIILDLHRDAPGRDKTTAVVDGVPMASLYVIVGTDRLLPNSHWEANYDFARRLVATTEQSYPGLSRGVLVVDERYNQHVMDRTLLLEVGGQENTFEEVMATVRALGEVLAQIVVEGFE